MFKLKKKLYPHSYLPIGKRFLIIIQLCIAFCMLLWYLFQPFMGDYFNLRNRALIYEFVLGKSTFIKDDSKLLRNAERFQDLPKNQQLDISNVYSKLQSEMNRDFLSKVSNGLHKFLWELPPFKLAWIFFTIWISILLLKGRPGAKHVVWILPLLTLCYTLDNQLYGSPKITPADSHLFPTENELIAHYSNESMNGSWDMPHQLKMAWDNYLISNWRNVNLDDLFPLEEAEFQFTLARIKAVHDNVMLIKSSFNEKESISLLVIYLLWNLLFAWRLSKN